MNLAEFGSKHVKEEVVALIPSLLIPIVPTMGMTEYPQDPVAAIEVAVVGALDLRDDPLFPRVAVPPVVEPVVFEAVARDLRGHIRPVQVIGPILSLRRIDPTQAQQSHGEGQSLDP
jgi:hypothetical protein